MFTNDPYTVKAVEYLVGIGFLVLFVIFWRVVNGEEVEPVAVPAHAWSGQLSEWFRMPERVFFHPGHAWARAESPGVVAIGIDDFAQQLVGPVKAVEMPQPGMRLMAGGRGWALKADSKAVDMVAPVTGTILAVNSDVAKRPDLVNEDPYGKGWLMKVKVPAGGLDSLVSGASARKWIERVSAELTATMSPELGHLLQDGGLPVHGLARGIDEEHWDEIARKFLQPNE